jgi:hypothetical protein
MEKIRVVVANEPRAYRETLADALRNLCPRAEVMIIEPAALHQHVQRFSPHLVLGSDLDPDMLTGLLSWVDLYPHGEPYAVINIGGERTTVDNLDLAGLLRIVDQTERLAGTVSCRSNPD